MNTFRIERSVALGKINVGDVLQYGKIQVEVLKVSSAMFFEVNGQESYELRVRKV